jgi:CubicO group peptidase (beta-lactamase class C family)
MFPAITVAVITHREGDAQLAVAREHGLSSWTILKEFVTGWASLEPAETLHGRHRFPAYSITKLITATVALRLVAEGRIALDDPANQHLRTVRLADDAVTVRELLTHTGGVASPDELCAGTVPELAALAGPVMACPGPRGTFRCSNGGYGMLGQLTLLLQLGSGRASVAMANRQDVPIEPVNARLLRPVA